MADDEAAAEAAADISLIIRKEEAHTHTGKHTGTHADKQTRTLETAKKISCVAGKFIYGAKHKGQEQARQGEGRRQGRRARRAGREEGGEEAEKEAVQTQPEWEVGKHVATAATMTHDYQASSSTTVPALLL